MSRTPESASAPPPHAFAQALAARDAETAIGLLSDEAEFWSPVLHKPYRGRAAIAPFLRAVTQVLEEFRYVEEYATPDGLGHALAFSARVGDRTLEGCDFIRCDDLGRVVELRVMVRPMTGAVALAGAMAPHLGSDDLKAVN